MKKIIALLSVLIFFWSCSSQSEEGGVLATNSWTAAFVQAATGETCDTLAPADMSHPPEYELTPGDMEKIMNSSLLVFAGYEKMMREIGSSADLESQEMLQIKTGFSMAVLRESIMAIAQHQGTEERAANSLESLQTLLDEKKELLQRAEGVNVVVHVHQKALAIELGFNVAGVFGPAPIELGELDKFNGIHADLIMDNGHNPQGEILRDVYPQAAYVECINFPGAEGTESLEDVIFLNTGRIEKVLF